jgi:hypothetical protein
MERKMFSHRGRPPASVSKRDNHPSGRAVSVLSPRGLQLPLISQAILQSAALRPRRRILSMISCNGLKIVCSLPSCDWGSLAKLFHLPEESRWDSVAFMHHSNVGAGTLGKTASQKNSTETSGTGTVRKWCNTLAVEAYLGQCPIVVHLVQFQDHLTGM